MNLHNIVFNSTYLKGIYMLTITAMFVISDYETYGIILGYKGGLSIASCMAIYSGIQCLISMVSVSSDIIYVL